MFVITLSEVIGLVVTGIILLVIIVNWLKDVIAQSGCNHDGGVNETQACHVICRKCGKDLGFIGTWRKQNGGNR